jgi:type I restriction enzyme, R subunit
MIPITDYKTIAESKNFIVLDKYAPQWKVSERYQSEYDLEREFIQGLQNQGYEYYPDVRTMEKLLANVRVQLQTLNNVSGCALSNRFWTNPVKACAAMFEE